MARVYRFARDRYRASRYHPEPTGLGFSILRGGEYANRLVGTELPTFKQHLEAADLLVDVGANVGFFSLLASRAGVDSLAIEPSPLNLGHLYENLRRAKGSGSVEVLPVAIADSIGVTDLLGSGQGASIQPGWGGIAANYRTPVPTTTLDSVLGRSNRTPAHQGGRRRKRKRRSCGGIGDPRPHPATDMAHRAWTRGSGRIRGVLRVALELRLQGRGAAGSSREAAILSRSRDGRGLGPAERSSRPHVPVRTPVCRRCSVNGGRVQVRRHDEHILHVSSPHAEESSGLRWDDVG